MSILSNLKGTIHSCLHARTQHIHPPPTTPSSNTDGFVLYLPTVSLRIDQNPSFALACHAANLRRVPLVVLAVVLDDAHHNTDESKVVATSRRLAFTLQALSYACEQWSKHGAAVGIRIHADTSGSNSVGGRKITGARTPDHLTLATRSLFVVADEPFVNPYLNMVQKVEEACRKSGVECVRVDGSCTVPPLQVLKRKRSTNDGVLFEGVPNKAYQWQNKTESLRMGHLKAAVEGAFDAPKLEVTMDDEELFLPITTETNEQERHVNQSTWGQRLAHLFPIRWKPVATAETGSDLLTEHNKAALPNAPDVRPFTSKELSHLYRNDDYFDMDTATAQAHGDTTTPSKPTTTPFHNFALHWPGADPTVPPVTHTIGTARHGMARWSTWVQNGGINNYARQRNDARNNLKGVSRMSAYLNLGIVSIFRLVWEVKQHPTSGASSNIKWKTGADKFEEEIIKFREHSYAHAFSRTDYDDVCSLPSWSVRYLDNEVNGMYTISRLAQGTAPCQKWNAMQKYLLSTGELHNNVRMTWGKSVVEWGVANSGEPESAPSTAILRALCYLNDRYALDGLSPPSYAGILWCMGWTDKPHSNGGVSPKPAYRYKMTADDFQEAEKKLLAINAYNVTQSGDMESNKSKSKLKRQPSLLDMISAQKKTANNTIVLSNTAVYPSDIRESTPLKGYKRKATIDWYFQGKSSKT